MTKTEKAQVTVEPEVYRQSPWRTVQEIFRLELPVGEDWDSIEEEIALAHADDLET